MKRALIALALLSAACGTDTIVAVRDSKQVSVPVADAEAPSPGDDGSTDPPPVPPPTAWRARRGRIVDANGNPVKIRAVTWSGFETPTYLPQGIYQRRLNDILGRIADLGFNTLRLPFSNELLLSTTIPPNPNADLNPDLEGLEGKDLLSLVIERAGAWGLRVILVHNRCDSGHQEDLWYTAAYPHSKFREDWVFLARTYSSKRQVVAFELHEGLRGSATWGDGNVATDFRLAAEDVGNAILADNPNVLIIVNGVQTLNDAPYVPGGNLAAARDFPVRLSSQERLVYGAADYPPDYMLAEFGDLTRFPWLVDPAFPASLPAVWDSRWAYLAKEDIAPVVLTSFGSKYLSVTDRQWLEKSVAFLQERDLGFAYWLLNPTIGNMDGLLEASDWNTTRPAYEAVKPLLGR